MSLANKTESIDKRKLFKIIIAHNRVHHDLILINDFFKFFVGFNLVSFFGFGIATIFVVILDLNWR